MPNSGLVVFAVRSIIVLVLLGIVWSYLIGPYSRLIVGLSGAITPSSVSARTLGWHIVFEGATPPPVTVNAMTLYSALVVVVALLISATGLRPTVRLASIASLAAVMLALQVVGVAALAHSIAWLGSRSGDSSTPVMFVYSSFAVFWNLVPLAVGGFWAYRFLLPKVSERDIVQTS